MDFLNLLIPKEKIIAMEISDRKIRMLYLEKDAYGKIKTGGASETDLEEGIISGGVIKDKERLSNALAKAKKDFKPAKAMSNFVIVTVPQSGIYSEILKFPKDLENNQLIEAISLNAAANLPIALPQCYIDWQIIGSEDNKNKVLVSLVSKETIDDYISVLKKEGFDLIALEPISLSFSRSIDFSDDPVVFLYFTNSGVTSIIYKDKIPYLSQHESWLELSDGKGVADINGIATILKAKAKSLVNYFENEYKNIKIKQVFIMNDEAGAVAIAENIGAIGVSVAEAKPNLDLSENNGWLQVAGAAKRAFIPRGEDTIISLLPVGTESLYETQKAVSFIKSIFLLLASMSVFYVVVFAVSFTFVSSMEARINSQLEARIKMPLPAEYQKIDSETNEFNNYARDLAKIYSLTNEDYAKNLEDINILNAPGVYLTSVNFNKPAGYAAVSGIALSRENLNAFKYQIDNSGIFKEVKYSVQNIAQKSNIPFNLSVYLK